MTVRRWSSDSDLQSDDYEPLTSGFGGREPDFGANLRQGQMPHRTPSSGPSHSLVGDRVPRCWGLSASAQRCSSRCSITRLAMARAIPDMAPLTAAIVILRHQSVSIGSLCVLTVRLALRSNIVMDLSSA